MDRLQRRAHGVFVERWLHRRFRRRGSRQSRAAAPDVDRAFERRWAGPAGIWRARLETFEPPPLDDAIRAELDDFVQRRRRELGD